MITKFGVTGHQNIPAEALPFIEEELKKVFSEHHAPFICVSSLAAGADQLFVELGLNHNAKLHAVIPCDNYSSTFKDNYSLKNYNLLLGKASKVEFLSFKEPAEEAFLQAGKRVTDLSTIIIAIWDGKKSKGKGGTADIVKYAENTQKAIKIIWPHWINR